MRHYANDGINGSVTIPAGISIFTEKEQSWMISHTVSLSPKHCQQLPLWTAGSHCQSGRESRIRF